MPEFDVGTRLKELRIQNKMSQRQLAEAAGVPNGQVSMIETNKSSPSVSPLRKILGGLRIGMAEFLSLKPSKMRSRSLRRRNCAI